MSVTTNDGRAKAVLNQLIDKFSTIQSLSSLFTDMGFALKGGEAIDIPTRSAIQIEQASTSPGTTSSMTVQSSSPTANTLTVDQHYGAIVEIPKFRNILDLNGAWSSQLADTIKTEMDVYMDQDHWDTAILSAAYDDAATYWVNPAGVTPTVAMVFAAMAKMANQKGVKLNRCVWVFNPWGIAAVSALPTWQINEATRDNAIGMGFAGTLGGIPVAMSQAVRTTRAVATTAAVISGTNTKLTLTVAAGHGIVPGMYCTTTGLSSGFNVTNKIVESVTATTVVLTITTGSDGTAGDGVGTLTANVTFNGLLHAPWAFTRKQQVPDVRVVPMTGGGAGATSKIADELQADMIWGRKVLVGGAIGFGTPSLAITG